MKKKFAWKILIVAIAMVLSLCMLVACGEKTTPPAVNPAPIYVPLEALKISIDVMDGNTKLGTIKNDTLLAITEERIAVTINKVDKKIVTTYVAYSFPAILTKLKIAVPTFTKVECDALDNKALETKVTDLNKSYIAVAIVENGIVKADSGNYGVESPKFISDKTLTISKGNIKNVKKIIFNPTTTPDVPPVVEPIVYDIPASLTVNVDMMNGETKLGTITNATLLEITQERLDMTIKGNPTTFIAYKFTDILAKLGITAPEFSKLVCAVSDGAAVRPVSVTDLGELYLAIGKLENDVVVPDLYNGVGGIRLIPDKSAIFANDMVKFATMIIFNPVTTEA